MKLTFILFAFIINFFNPTFIKADEIIDSSNNQIENTTKVKSTNNEISDIKKFPENLTVSEILIRSSNVGSTKLAKLIGKEGYKNFFKETNLLDAPNFELEEVGVPLPLNLKNKCKLETISFGHGISVTPLQATATYAALVNGGYYIKPTMIKKEKYKIRKKIVSEKTS